MPLGADIQSGEYFAVYSEEYFAKEYFAEEYLAVHF